MDEAAVTNPPATKPDDMRKARAERLRGDQGQDRGSRQACAETRKIIYDLRRLLRQ